MMIESKQANDRECREQSVSERRNWNPICPEGVVLMLFLPGTAHVQAQCCQLFNFFFQKDHLSILNLTFLKVGSELKVIKTCVNETTPIRCQLMVSNLFEPSAPWVSFESNLLEKKSLGCLPG